MPLPLFAIAIPVLHSSGAWIASTGAAGYIAGTLSSTWIGAFVLGNGTLLSSLGLVSAAGIFGATGGLAAVTSSAALSVGSALTAVGLGGVASSLGIAPVATFLGLTPVGWALAGTTVAITSTLGFYFTRKTMRRINEEREKGCLEPISITQIVKEVRLLEAQSLKAILMRLSLEMDSVQLSDDEKDVSIDGQVFSVHRLKYVVNADGSEELVFVTRIGRKRTIFLIKAASEPGGQPA
ncbi:hypothetical protein [Neptunicoccus cionae]|uniref:hypothetical protein n=1 Tax=Neptunicoccus cionae TaxID=2035344 RepID=UPI000C765968|nr:hypothetical protein [Amylibacter cionae]PLS22171.1 hypothetical protein C0U40_06980 [Amylibacter cionae]